MDVLIITQYYYNLESNNNDTDRFVYLANMLIKRNVNVEIVTSNFIHITKKHARTISNIDKFKLTVLNEPGYKKNVSLKRLYSHRKLSENLAKYLNSRQLPDLIYCAVPSLSVSNVARKYCLRNNIKFVIDVQDLWPEAFKLAFNIPIISNIVFSPMTFLANKIYKAADIVVSVSKSYAKRVKSINKKCKEYHIVFLGNDLEIFDENKRKKPLYNKKENEIWIGYCGTLGSSYDLKTAIDGISLLNNYGQKKVKFIIMGDGPLKQHFIDYAMNKKVDCLFTGRLLYSDMCALLCNCDIAVNPLKHNAPQSIINKHGDYAMAGIPVVSTQENEEYRNLLDQYHFGFNCANENPEDFASKLQILINDKELRLNMGINSRKCALERFDRKKTYVEIVELIEKNLKENNPKME